MNYIFKQNEDDYNQNISHAYYTEVLRFWTYIANAIIVHVTYYVTTLRKICLKLKQKKKEKRIICQKEIQATLSIKPAEIQKGETIFVSQCTSFDWLRGTSTVTHYHM